MNNSIALNTDTLQQLKALGRGGPGDRVYFRAILPKQLTKAADPDGVLAAFKQRLGLSYYSKPKSRWVDKTPEFYLEDGQLWEKIYSDFQPCDMSRLTEVNQYYGLYMVVNSGGKSAKAITSGSVVFYECDDISKKAQWAKVSQFETDLRVNAAAIVETKKSLHVYFGLEEPMTDMAAWTAMQKRLIARMESDKGIHNADRIMRAVGFDHISFDLETMEFVRVPVKLRRFSEDKVSLLALDRILPLPPVVSVATNINGFVKPASNNNYQGNFDGPSLSELVTYLNGFDGFDSQGIARVQCPHHTKGNEANHSANSLHVWQDGHFKAHCGCNNGDVWKASFELAVLKGFTPPARKTPVRLSKEEWKARNVELNEALKGLGSYVPNNTVNMSVLEITGLLCGLNFISSACKTGKTTAITKIEREHLTKGFPVVHLTYRNGLVYQTCVKAGIPHVSSFKGNRAAINKALGVGMCLDSLHWLNLADVRENILFVIDEADATLRHGLEGGTLGDKQGVALTHFAAYLKAAIAKGGKIVLMEDSITDLTIDSYRDIVGRDVPVNILLNTKLLSHWPIRLGDGSYSGMVRELVDFLKSGKRAMLGSDSQRVLAAVERLIVNAGMDIKILRVDSTTMDDQDVKDFVNNPDAYLAANHVDLLLYSPSVESGLSIWYEGFDRVFGYFSHSEPRQIVQMMERYRLNVPRDLFCKRSAGNSHISNFDPATIKAELEFKRADTFNRVGAPEFKGSELNGILNTAYANYRARANAAKIALLHNLADEFVSRGHNVTVEPWEKDKQVVSDLKTAKDEVAYDEACEKSSADATRYGLEEAKEKLQAGDLGRRDRNDCLKTVMTDRLPGLDLDCPDVMHFVTVNKGENVKGTLRFLQFQYPDLAQNKDLAQLKSLTYGTDVMLNHRIHHDKMQADLLGTCKNYIEWLLRNPYTNLSPAVEKLSALLIDAADTVRKVFKLTMEAPRPRIVDENGKIVQQERTHIMNVNKILRLFKMTVGRGKKGTVGGTRIQEYQVTQSEFWMATYQSLLLKYAEQIAKIPAQPATSTVFSINTSYLKTVDVRSDSAPSEAEILKKEYESIEF